MDKNLRYSPNKNHSFSVVNKPASTNAISHFVSQFILYGNNKLTGGQFSNINLTKQKKYFERKCELILI